MSNSSEKMEKTTAKTAKTAKTKTKKPYVNRETLLKNLAHLDEAKTLLEDKVNRLEKQVRDKHSTVKELQDKIAGMRKSHNDAVKSRTKSLHDLVSKQGDQIKRDAALLDRTRMDLKNSRLSLKASVSNKEDIIK